MGYPVDPGPELDPIFEDVQVMDIEPDFRPRPMPRPRYEYKKLWNVNLIEGITEGTLNVLGDQGWHIVGMIGNWIFLERPKLWSHNWYLSCCHGRPCCESCLSNCSAARETE